MNSAGYDIPPDQERRMFVDVLTGFTNDTLNIENEPIYQRYRMNRPENYVFTEPLDLTDAEGSSVDTTMHQPTPDSERNSLDHFSERERLRTFDGHWDVVKYHVRAEDLAKHGFIYKGPGDRVMCVFCLKIIKEWEAGDSVPDEHKRLYPRCPWVLGKATIRNKPISEGAILKSDMRLNAKGIPQVSDMTRFEKRKNTLSAWTRSNSNRRNIDIDKLAKDGFFFDFNKSQIICFHCGFSIAEERVDNDYNHSHATNPNSSRCPMVNQRHAGITSSEENHNYQNGASYDVVTDNDNDMESPAVQAVLSSFGEDYTIEEIRMAVSAIRLVQGSGEISSEDILKKLDPTLDQ